VGTLVDFCLNALPANPDSPEEREHGRFRAHA
jgi:hypothetical protein